MKYPFKYTDEDFLIWFLFIYEIYWPGSSSFNMKHSSLNQTWSHLRSIFWPSETIFFFLILTCDISVFYSQTSHSFSTCFPYFQVYHSERVCAWQSTIKRISTFLQRNSCGAGAQWVWYFWRAGLLPHESTGWVTTPVCSGQTTAYQSTEAPSAA